MWGEGCDGGEGSAAGVASAVVAAGIEGQQAYKVGVRPPVHFAFELFGGSLVRGCES